MIFLLIVALPICIEIAAWATDSSFERLLLKSPQPIAFEDEPSQTDTVISF